MRNLCNMKSESITKYWAEVFLFGIIVIAGFLDLWNLWNQGFSNPYYAAAVRSMLANPGLAFFNPFDAAGFVTVDKPPVGIWIQAVSAAMFGFSNWSVILPQALAGIGFADCGEDGETLGVRGKEFGTNTGRKRRCGWLDAVALRQAVKTGGIEGIALTKLDILDAFKELKICRAYKLNGKLIDYLPAGQQAQGAVEPVYDICEGWNCNTRGMRNWADLPSQALNYIRRIEEAIEAPVILLSTSPERDDTILMKDPFAD